MSEKSLLVLNVALTSALILGVGYLYIVIFEKGETLKRAAYIIDQAYATGVVNKIGTGVDTATQLAEGLHRLTGGLI